MIETIYKCVCDRCGKEFSSKKEYDFNAHTKEKSARNIAIQDFAERLKESIPNYIGYDDSQLHEYIDNLAKEMVGAQE